MFRIIHENGKLFTEKCKSLATKGAKRQFLASNDARNRGFAENKCNTMAHGQFVKKYFSLKYL